MLCSITECFLSFSHPSFFCLLANNTCFMTECRQYCELSKTPVCGKPDRVEGSVQSYLPFELEVGHRKTWINPFKRAYRLARGGAMYVKFVVYYAAI